MGAPTITREERDRITARRRWLDDEMATERRRHRICMDLLHRERRKLEASCPHPEEEEVGDYPDPAGNDGHESCDLCGAWSAGRRFER